MPDLPFGTSRSDLLTRQQVMDLIEATIPLWADDQIPRHALSTLWGKVRDMPATLIAPGERST